MNTQEMTEIRNLTSDEMEDVSGALKIQIGPVRIKVLEGEMIFSISMDGVGAFCIDTQGIWTA
jgi:ABC-type siderophore export system fused ATPase/permease subunit